MSATIPRLRTRFTAAREGFGLLGVVLAAALPAVLAADLGDGIARLAWILPPLLLVAALITFSPRRRRASRCRPPASRCCPACAGSSPIAPSAACCWSSSPTASPPRCRRRCSCSSSPTCCSSKPASGPLLALYFVAGAASLPLWVRLAGPRRPGRSPGWRRWACRSSPSPAPACSAAAICWPFAAICLASGLALGADLALPAAIAADLGERQGQAGACFGVWNFVAKLNLALAAGLSLPLLGAARLCAGRQRRPARADLCLRPAAARLQGAGRRAALALAPFSGDLIMKLLLAAAFTLGLAGCASTGVEQYRAEQPALDLKTYLNGTLDAWGMFQGRSGEVQEALPCRHRRQMDGRHRRARRTLQVVGRHHLAPRLDADQAARRHASAARPTMWSARPSAKFPAMPCAGATCWRCRSMARPITSISTTGCS